MSRNTTFADWKRKMRDEIWPSGYPENVLNSINSYFIVGCMDLQRTIVCLQENNAIVFPACATFFNGGLTFVNVPGPRMKIRRVWTIANGDWNNKVFYRQREHAEVADWSLNLLHYTAPLNAGLPKLPMGDRYTEKSTDSRIGRSRAGIWSLNRRRVYLAPWIQSNESVVIEWDGVRVDWSDTDLIDLDVWDPLHEQALKLYVKWCYERDFGSSVTDTRQAKQDYDDQVALLINDCTDLIARRNEEGVPLTHAATGPDIIAEKIPAEETVPALAIIGGYGSADATESKIAALVKSWSPLAILTVGGNNGGDVTDADAWDSRVGQYFQDYIFPYAGIYGAGSEANKFWPALDTGELSSASVFFDYFKSASPNHNDVIVGNVHFFIIHGSADYTAALVWLQGALALSTARWKVVIINAALDFAQDFTDFGADLVVYGRQEAYDKTGVVISFGSFISPVALKLSASCTKITVLAIDANGTQVDSLTIT